MCLVIFINGYYYLENKQQKTVVNGVTSGFQHVSTGAPQRLLAPRLFSIAEDDLPDLSDDHEEDLFVDDTTATFIGDTIDTYFEKAQKMFDDIGEWSQSS